jgi:hypothetical protein
MKKWEYFKCTHYNSTTESNSLEVINSLGEDGWELVSVHHYETVTVFYFKRPKE